VKAILVLISLHFVMLTFGQQGKTATQLPPFRMALASGGYFTSESLKKDRPVLLIYFAPDCDHCKLLMDDFFKRPEAFQTAEVVMVTYAPLSEVVSFIGRYNVNKYPFITVGSEIPQYYFRFHYKLLNTPFTALFNSKRQMVVSYRKDTPVADLIAKLKAVN
jgi:thiol-disulfide isomerase/thioredoxin